MFLNPKTFLSLTSNKMLAIMVGFHKMLDRIINRENPDQTKKVGLLCLSRPFWQVKANFVQNFRTSNSNFGGHFFNRV